MKAVWRSDIGRRRVSNQDACLIMPQQAPVYAVADGMGGHHGGDIASAMAVQGLRVLLKDQLPQEQLIRQCFDQISRDIYLRQLQEEALSGMGTTLTLLWEDVDRMYLGHVGDSRAYLLRGGELSQVTRDHSLVSELLSAGVIDHEAAKEYPYRNVITRAVGTEEQVSCDIYQMDKLPGDRWLLCSDGLSEYVEDAEMLQELQLDDLDRIADRLVKQALDQGGADNITLVLLEVAP